MSEVLSQNEIDNLMAALSTGELDVDQIQKDDEKKTKDYDFKRPAKFSKEHLRTLEIIFEHYARLLSTALPIQLRKPVQVSVGNSETVTYSEFSNALSNPVILGVVNFRPLQGNIIIELQANIGFSFIDRMLGGVGKSIDKPRPFTDIELPLIEKLMDICIQHLVEPWQNVLSIDPYLERIETNPQFAQVISPTDMIAIVTLNIKIGDTEGLMNVCLPYFTLESIMDRLNTKYWFSTMQKNKDENDSEYLESLIKHVDIPIKAVLGKSHVSVSDFVHLQVGDIIRLDNKVNSEMHVYVGNIDKFRALPGTTKDNNAVRITSVIREEE